MTDKELLELAAKAAGIEGLQWESDGTMQNRMNRPTIPYDCHGMLSAIDWNPLKSDADALRLAVKLGIGFELNFTNNRAWSNGTVEEYTDDPYAATRRAIVRAAAEIGKKTK